MHTELTQQEGLSVRLSVRTSMINFNCTKNVKYANNEVFEACSWELRLKILMEAVRSFEISESVYLVM